MQHHHTTTARVKQMMEDLRLIKTIDSCSMRAAKELSDEHIRELYQSKGDGISYGQRFNGIRSSCDSLASALSNLSPAARNLLSVEGKTCEEVREQWTKRIYQEVWKCHQKLSLPLLVGDYFGTQSDDHHQTQEQQKQKQTNTFSFSPAAAGGGANGASSSSTFSFSGPFVFGKQTNVSFDWTANELGTKITNLPTSKMLSDIDNINGLKKIKIHYGPHMMSSRGHFFNEYASWFEMMEDAKKIFSHPDPSTYVMWTNGIMPQQQQQQISSIKKELSLVKKDFHRRVARIISELSEEAAEALSRKTYEYVIDAWDTELERRNQNLEKHVRVQKK
jgi:hypothetical protein